MNNIYKLPRARETLPPEEQISELTQQFEQRPSVGLCKALGTLLKQFRIPKTQYGASGVLSHFFASYQREFGMDYPNIGMNDLRAALVEFEDMLDEMNPDIACKCVDVLFSPDMEWVNTKTLSMMRKSNRDKFLLPLVAKSKRRPKGEFAEWRGDERSLDLTVRKI